MRTIVLGDIHGLTIWKDIINKENPDRVVFIGDYFDSYDILGVEQIANFLDIINYKEESNGEVIMLIGNHDFQYGLGDSKCSGYQYGNALQISIILNEHKNKLQIAYSQNDIIFTHAGITKTWVQTFGIKDNENLAESINELFKYKPNSFAFNGYDQTGDNITQTPLWIRPNSLMKDSVDWKQVFGHTLIKRIEPLSDKFWNIDVLATSKEYLIIEDGIVSISKL